MNGPPAGATQQNWLERYGGLGIGLLTGCPLPGGERLGAVDVDQNDFTRVTEVVLCLK